MSATPKIPAGFQPLDKHGMGLTLSVYGTSARFSKDLYDALNHPTAVIVAANAQGAVAIIPATDSEYAYSVTSARTIGITSSKHGLPLGRRTATIRDGIAYFEQESGS
jgi:hypothetical protein